MYMQCQPVISRGDLLRLFDSFGSESLEKASAFAGYRRELPATIPVKTVKEEATKEQVSVSGQSTLPDVPDEKILIPFWRPVVCKQLETKRDRGHEPNWYIEAEDFEQGTIRADKALRPPAPQPLCRWSRIWPFLRGALGTAQPWRGIDPDQVVRLAAELKPINPLPRLMRRGWSRRGTVILDVDSRLVPFWRDMRHLCDHLVKLRGAGGLYLFLLGQGPYGPVNRPGIDRHDMASFKLPAPGTPILIVSDLGLFDSSDRMAGLWLRFGRRLRRAGFFPIVLTPAPRRLWTAELADVFRMACWDRGQRLPKPMGSKGRGHRPLAYDRGTQGTATLMTLLSPAIRVEPGLLRAMRLLLPVNMADAGHEASVWNHAGVLRGYTGYSFDLERTARFRETFSEGPPSSLKQRACELIQIYHRHLSPAIALEEKMHADMLLHGDIPEESEQFFRRVAKTHSNRGFKSWSGLNAYMHRVVRRQDARMWKSEALSTIWAKLKQKEWIRGKIGLPHGLDPARIMWVLAEEGRSETYTVLRRGGDLIIEKGHQPKAATEKADVSGSPVIAFVSSNGALKIRATDMDQRMDCVVNLNSKMPPSIQVPTKGRLHLVTTHNEITLESMKTPPWAEGWGRDEHGLFLLVPEDEHTRKTYWTAPGRYPVGGPVDTSTTTATLTDTWDSGTAMEFNAGFWWDEREFKEHARKGFSRPAWASDFGKDDHGIYAEFQVDSVVQRMRWIMPGEFLMGSPPNEPERDDDEQQHKVILTRGFWLADTACTQALWRAVMGNNPSDFKGDDRPVDSISWHDTREFFEKINVVIPGLDLCLPSEAQWEYACRAGTTTPFHFGKNITTDQVNFDGNYPYNKARKGQYREKTVPVKHFPCNAWGVYEMHGNVWEWCADWFGNYPEITVVDPTGPVKGKYRVVRGGSWIYYGRNVRSAYRDSREPSVLDHYQGLRVARGQPARSEPPGGTGQEGWVEGRNPTRRMSPDGPTTKKNGLLRKLFKK